MSAGVLAVIPARGGSKGLPKKNILPVAGIPLIGHAILLGRRCPEITRLVVSTDADDIAEAARSFGADVPFRRPASLAGDETPMWPVVRHAQETVEQSDGRAYEYVLLLDPTTIGRLPEDVSGAFRRLREIGEADGIVGVSRPEFNPIWHGVVEQDGWMVSLLSGGEQYDRRQDVPPVYRINASLYIWRRQFVRQEPNTWRRGRLLLFEIPDWRVMHIESRHDLDRADLLVRHGLIQLPWVHEER